MTKEDYGRKLDENLDGLLDRMKRQAYKPQPVKRVYIPKVGSTKMRPLGILIKHVINTIQQRMCYSNIGLFVASALLNLVIMDLEIWTFFTFDCSTTSLSRPLTAGATLRIISTMKKAISHPRAIRIGKIQPA